MNKLNLLSTLVIFTASASAFASPSYTCGTLHNAKGQPRLGLPTSVVRINGTTATVSNIELTGEQETTLDRNPKAGGPDLQVYEGGGITISVVTTSISADLMVRVTLSEKIQGEVYTASCPQN